MNHDDPDTIQTEIQATPTMKRRKTLQDVDDVEINVEITPTSHETDESPVILDESLQTKSEKAVSIAPSNQTPKSVKVDKFAPEHDMDDTSSTSEDLGDEDEEPKLKYSRLSGTLSGLLKKDSVSCMAVSDRFIAVGTHWGMIHILDLTGNDIKRFKSHTATVNELCIDAQAEYVASCSDDGRVVINSLYSAETWPFARSRPMKAVAMEPEYSKKTTKALVSGGMSGQLISTSKGWLGYKDTLLHTGEGPIFTVKWRGLFIAWCNEIGIRVHDTSLPGRIGLIQRPKDSPRADLFRPSICWKDDKSFLVGWADWVCLAEIVDINRSMKMSPMDSPSPSPSQPSVLSAALTLGQTTVVNRELQVLRQFRTDYIVSGIAPMVPPAGSNGEGNSGEPPIDQQLVLLSFVIDHEDRDVDKLDNFKRKRESRPPEIRITDLDGDELANDVLTLHGYELYQAGDYKLDFLPFDRTYYILSPKDIIVARPRDLADHIEWLLERQRYEEALIAAENAGSDYSVKGRLKVEDIMDIGQKYLGTLMTAAKYSEAAATCGKILRGDVALWEQWVYAFAEVKQLEAIAPFIPTTSPTINPTVYEMVLLYLLQNNIPLFHQIITSWPSTIYNLENVLMAVEEEQQQRQIVLTPFNATTLQVTDDDRFLLESSLFLYQASKQYQKAIPLALYLQVPDALAMIPRFNLYRSLPGYIPLVMRYDEHLLDNDGVLVNSIQQMQEVDNVPTSLLSQDLQQVREILKEDVQFRLRVSSYLPGVELLCKATDRGLSVDTVVKELSALQDNRPLFIYLSALTSPRMPSVISAEGDGYHDLLVSLLADNDEERLLDFLRSSTHYSVPQAFEVCKKRDCVPEMVYLLGKMGDNKQALSLIIDRMADVRRAIQFAREQNDKELWNDLVEYSMDKPKFILALLESVGQTNMDHDRPTAIGLDPLELVKKIPNGLTIPGLKPSLMRLLEDVTIQLSLMDVCDKILIGDTLDLLHQLHGQQAGGIIFDKVSCSSCQFPVEEPFNGAENVVIFFCRHVFHDTCLSGKVIGTKVGNQLEELERRFSMVKIGTSMLGSVKGGQAYQGKDEGLKVGKCPLCHPDDTLTVSLLKTDAEIRQEPLLRRTAGVRG